jgi:hypothetical protein
MVCVAWEILKMACCLSVHDNTTCLLKSGKRPVPSQLQFILLENFSFDILIAILLRNSLANKLLSQGVQVEPEVLGFGHIMYEMACGCELDEPFPTFIPSSVPASVKGIIDAIFYPQGTRFLPLRVLLFVFAFQQSMTCKLNYLLVWCVLSDSAHPATIGDLMTRPFFANVDTVEQVRHYFDCVHFLQNINYIIVDMLF